MTVTTRFAPSPTGFLHIGGARTALFNHLFARANGGKYLLRVEDTDKERSTDEAKQAIIDGLEWLGLSPDDAVVFQSEGLKRHQEVVQKLLDEGKAYKCFCTPEELQEMRNAAEKNKQPFKYDRHWRDRDPSEAPEGAPYSVRIKAPLEDSITLKDHVQGEVTITPEQLDDFVILRSDGTPTYMLAVVVDDHDMGITHVIRGDDHMNNAFRQAVIFSAMGWDLPEFAHIPLIHGPDGAKLSKRHGALGVEAYREMGYLPEALRNYLLRLGFSHGDAEIISDSQAIEWFRLDAINKAPSRIDFDKLDHVNGHYIREADDERIYALCEPHFTALYQEMTGETALPDTIIERLTRSMASLKQRTKNLKQLTDSAKFLMIEINAKAQDMPINDPKAAALVSDNASLLGDAADALASLDPFTHDALYAWAQRFAESKDLKLGKLMNPIRAAITASTASPSMFEVMEILGKEESIARLKAALALDPQAKTA